MIDRMLVQMTAGKANNKRKNNIIIACKKKQEFNYLIIMAFITKSLYSDEVVFSYFLNEITKKLQNQHQEHWRLNLDTSINSHSNSTHTHTPSIPYICCLFVLKKITKRP